MRERGYTNVRHFKPGFAGWQSAGERIEQDVGVRRPIANRTAERPHRHRDALLALVDRVGNLPLAPLITTWIGMVAACGVLYWIVGAAMGNALRDANGPIAHTFDGFMTALYFSFVTALSVGYGDVIPMGAVRLLAIGEAMAGLLLFGVLISKFVSRRQDVLIEEIHRTTFEERLGRLRTNLHLVLSELQTLAEVCAGSNPSPRTLVRIESAGAVFVGELQSIHDLLYRPQDVPDETVLEAILASLGSCLDEFANLLSCFPATARTLGLRAELAAMSKLADDICGECVPRDYAPELKGWMDRVRDGARKLTV